MDIAPRQKIDSLQRGLKVVKLIVSVLVVGMSHRSAPVSLLERLSMDDVVRSQTTTRLVDKPSITEAMIISTCNRMEVYAMAKSFHTGVQDVVKVLHDISGVDMETLRGYLYVRYADAAAEHAFTVTSGLDSMVVGEQQIIGQVRSAYQEATEQGTVGQALHGLVQAALHTGKRVHSETDIDDAGASMVSFAMDEALRLMGVENLEGKTALVLGAGAMSSLAATHAGKAGVQELVIANRTKERAERLAGHSEEAGVPARVVDFADRASVLGEVDMVISATGADGFTVNAADIPVRETPLMLVDLSLPRDINPDVTETGAQLVNIEHLHEAHAEGEVPANAEATEIISEELKAFTSEQRVRDVAPAVTALRRHAADVVASELDRLRGRVPGVTEDEFVEVTKAVRRVVDKLLHNPTVKAKELAVESGVVSYESALQEFFGLVDAETNTDQERSVALPATALPGKDFKVEGD